MMRATARWSMAAKCGTGFGAGLQPEQRHSGRDRVERSAASTRGPSTTATARWSAASAARRPAATSTGSTPPPPPGGGVPPPGAAVPPPGAAAPPPFGGAPVAAGPTPEQQAELKAKNQVPAIIALVAGILLIVGSFLPWASLDLGGDSDSFGIVSIEEGSINGWDTADGEVGDGPIFAFFGLIVAVMGGLGLAGITNLGTKIATIVFGVLALLVTFLEFADIASTNDDLESFGFDASFSYGFGLVVLLLAAIAAIVAGALMKRRL